MIKMSETHKKIYKLATSLLGMLSHFISQNPDMLLTCNFDQLYIDINKVR